MRVIVTGCRSWQDRELVWEWLNKLPKEGLVIVHGGCPTGADAAADQWAILNTKRGPEVVPAQWDKHGKAAGPMRNQEMADRGAKMCLAFWDGESSGTKDMILKAAKAHIPVRIVPPRSKNDLPKP